MTVLTGHAAPSRDGRGKFRRDLAHVERDAQAAALYESGRSYQQVADEMGYPGKGEAWRAIQRVMREAAQGTKTEDLRLRQLAELEALAQEMWRTVLDPPPAYDRLGHVVHDDDGRVVVDEMARQGAVDRIIRVYERIGRLRGLDAPKRSVTATFDIPQADLEAHVAQMRNEYAAQQGITVEELEVHEARAQIEQAQAVLARHGMATGTRALVGKVEDSGHTA